MNGETPQSKHISTFYLTKDPRKLGGRAVGPAGTPGSNNGGEKKGGTIQKKFADLTKKYSNKEKKNPIHICIAIAYDQHGSPHFSKFATSPIKHSDDFDMVRTTAEHPLEMANLGSNLLYMVFTSTDWKDMTVEERRKAVEVKDPEVFLDPVTILGDSMRSFIVHCPNGQVTYPLVRQYQKEVALGLLSAPFSERRHLVSINDEANTPEKCHRILATLPADAQATLYDLHLRDLAENVPGKKEQENFDSFVKRRCHRTCRESGRMSTRTKIAADEQKSRASKKKQKNQRANDAAQLEKYGTMSSNDSSGGEHCICLHFLIHVLICHPLFCTFQTMLCRMMCAAREINVYAPLHWEIHIAAFAPTTPCMHRAELKLKLTVIVFLLSSMCLSMVTLRLDGQEYLLAKTVRRLCPARARTNKFAIIV